MLLINRASLVDHPSAPLVISAELDNNWLLIEYLSAQSLIKSIPLLYSVGPVLEPAPLLEYVRSRATPPLPFGLKFSIDVDIVLLHTLNKFCDPPMLQSLSTCNIHPKCAPFLGVS